METSFISSSAAGVGVADGAAAVAAVAAVAAAAAAAVLSGSSSLSAPVPAMPETANSAFGSNLPSTACFSTFL